MDKYRVIVLREGDAGDETLFEIAGGGAMVTTLGPDAVRLALIEARESEGAAGAIRSPELADRVFDSAVAAGNAAEAQSAPAAAEPPKPTRTRRTKAQIEADKAAQAAGFRDAAHQAEVAAQQAGQPTMDVPPIPGSDSVYVAPPGEQVVITPAAPATPVVLDGAGNAITPVGVGDQPWNPFTQ